MKNALIILSISVLAGCGTVKETSAPCKRPANLTSFAEVDPRRECPSMAPVNADQSAVDALNAIVIGP
ncbi:hypothetical protein RU07_23065 [Agrobacterium tumefaciens]|uniref:Uncharacterized protein n=1 Tax=Agrobacterium tumefaciens TaxID=358 RepID=A0A0D0IY36_AGRTU|nr:hypothetical protein RU07_23065 [Agrobacterium tumefaciens]